MARDFTPLPAIYTDADWSVDVGFYGATVDDPLDLSGGTFSLVLAPSRVRTPAAELVYELATEVTLAAPHLVAIRAPKATVDGWEPGAYLVELRRLEGGAVEVLYAGGVTIARGLSQVAEFGGSGVLPGETPGAVQVFQAVRVIRGEAAGAAGEAAASAAAAADDRQLAREAADEAVAAVVARAVRYDAAQALTSPQMTQARSNIGAATAGDPETDFGGRTITMTGGDRVLFEHDPATVDPEAGVFRLVVDTGDVNPPGGNFDTVWKIGYNIQSNGTRQRTDRPALSVNWESEFWSGGIAGLEWHLNYEDVAGAALRPINLFLPHDLAAGSVLLGLQADLHYLKDAANVAKVIFDFSGANPVIQFDGGGRMRFGVNNIPVALQLNAAGDSTFNLPYIDNLDRTVISSAPYAVGPTKNTAFLYLQATSAAAGDHLILGAFPAITGGYYASRVQGPVSGTMRSEWRNTGAGKVVVQAIANGASGDAMFATEAGTDWSFGTRKSDGAFVLSKTDSSFGDPKVTVDTAGIAAFVMPPKLPTYTVATLPSAAANPRGLAYVSDGASNKRLAISDSTNWRWPDGAVVS